MPMINYITRLISFIIAALGILTMGCWMFFQQDFSKAHPEIYTMVFNTALCFALIGITYLFHVRGSMISEFIEILLGTFLIAISAITLFEYIFNFDIGIDQLFVKVEHVKTFKNPGRMSGLTATGFFFSGLSIIFLKIMKTNSMFFMAHLLILTILFMSLFAIIQNEIFDVANTKYTFNRVAPHTALCLLLLCVILWADWYCLVRKQNFELDNTNTANLVRLSILYFGIVITFLMVLIVFI